MTKCIINIPLNEAVNQAYSRELGKLAPESAAPRVAWLVSLMRIFFPTADGSVDRAFLKNRRGTTELQDTAVIAFDFACDHLTLSETLSYVANRLGIEEIPTMYGVCRNVPASGIVSSTFVPQSFRKPAAWLMEAL